MLDFITKIFRRDESSRSLAKERLRLVLMSDRVALAPETFDLMKGEMLSVLQRYVDVDEQGIDVLFENAERRFMLYSNIPITSVNGMLSAMDHIRGKLHQRVGAGAGGVIAPRWRMEKAARRLQSKTRRNRRLRTTVTHGTSAPIRIHIRVAAMAAPYRSLRRTSRNRRPKRAPAPELIHA